MILYHDILIYDKEATLIYKCFKVELKQIQNLGFKHFKL